MPVGSIRPPPVHFPVGHCAGGGVTQKLGRFGDMLMFGWSLHAEASSPAASRLGQMMRFPCSRNICVLPSVPFDDSRELIGALSWQGRCHPVGGANLFKCRDIPKMLKPRGDARAATPSCVGTTG